MRRIFTVLVCLLCFTTVTARADIKPDEGQLLVPPPMLEPANPDGSRCFFVENTAPYTVTGSIISNYMIDFTGKKARQTTNFRLAAKQKQEYCSAGPYYPGTRLGIMIRTLVPVFSCYTVAQGTIQIHGEYTPGKGSRSWIDCQ